MPSEPSEASPASGASRPRRTPYRHPVNQEVFEAAPLGARVADRVTGLMGSWRFIAIQTVLVALWLGANLLLLTQPFDPFPFILLNLAFSTQAAYAAPLILLAGNRASHRDRLTLEHAAAEADLADAQNRRLLEGNTEILNRVAALEDRILSMEQRILSAVANGVQARPDPVDRPPMTRGGTTQAGIPETAGDDPNNPNDPAAPKDPAETSAQTALDLDRLDDGGGPPVEA